MKSVLAFFLGLFSIFSHTTSVTPAAQSLITSTPMVSVNINSTNQPAIVATSSVSKLAPINMPTVSIINGVATTPPLKIQISSETTNVSIQHQVPINVPTASAISGLILSLDSSTPLSSTIAVSQGSNENEALGVQGLVFDLTNNTANPITTPVNIAMQFGSPSVTTAYLYGGSNEISSAPVVNGNSTLSDVDFSIPAHMRRVFTVLFDVKNVSGSSTIVPSIASVFATTSQGNIVSTSTVSGSAVGNTLTITGTALNITPLVSVVSVPTIVSNGYLPAPVLTATFNVSIQATGGDISFANGSVSAKPFDFSIYKNEVSNDMSAYSYTESFAIPASGVVTQGLLNGMAFKLLQNNTVTIPVTLNFTPTGSTAARYYVSLNSVTVENDNGETQTIPTNQTLSSQTVFAAGAN